MKEKLKKILKYISSNWRHFIEIGAVVWAVNGMWRVLTLEFFKDQPEVLLEFYKRVAGRGVNIFWMPLLFYLFSAILTLYLLRKHERKNN